MNWPQAGGKPAASGVLRAANEDFCVREVLGFDPDGTGEHSFLWVRKSGANTGWVAQQLAAFAGVRAADVGYAGRKDRHALCEQWFSVHLPGQADPDWSGCRIEGAQVLRTARHSRKLRPGALSGNQFEIKVRQLQGDRDQLENRLQVARQSGVPNYFGAQRFGINNANVERARALFSGRRLGRAQRSMALSAARAVIFNNVLGQRVGDKTWEQARQGDCLVLDGSRSYFLCERPDEDLSRRLQTGDIHVSGPLWGRGELATAAAIALLEQQVAGAEKQLSEGLEHCGLKQERRALRVIPQQLDWQLDDDELLLKFYLPRGSFATAVIAELLNC